MNVPAALIDPADQGDEGEKPAPTLAPEGNERESGGASDQGSEKGTPSGDTEKEKGESTPEEGATPELVKLPDGREVSAAEAIKEMREHFLPEYTRATTELKELKERGVPDLTKSDATKEKRPWENPDWVPETYKDVIEAAAEAAKLAAQAEREAAERSQTEIRTIIDTQLAEIKQTDKNLDEEALFKWSNKWGFTDLRLAHANMMENRAAARKAGEDAAGNIRQRGEGVPVSGKPSSGTSEEGIDYGQIAGSRSMADAVADHWARLRK